MSLAHGKVGTPERVTILPYHQVLITWRILVLFDRSCNSVSISQDIPRPHLRRLNALAYQVNTKTSIILHRVEKLFDSAEISQKRGKIWQRKGSHYFSMQRTRGDLLSLQSMSASCFFIPWLTNKDPQSFIHAGRKTLPQWLMQLHCTEWLVFLAI